MAINVSVGSSNKPLLSNELIYKRLDNQTPMDFAVCYLKRIEDLFSFYSTFSMGSYDEFNNNDKYRIPKVLNPMRLNGFECATRAEDLTYNRSRARIWTLGRSRIFGSGINDIRSYK